MTKENFKKGVNMLGAVLGNLKPKPERLDIWFDLLNDIDDHDFERAVRTICNEVKEIYPGTNIVALIREQITPDDGMKIL